MSTVMTKVIIDCSTGEERIEPLTDIEIAEIEEKRNKAATEQALYEAELEAKEQAKASALAKLAVLGLTEEEAKALIK